MSGDLSPDLILPLYFRLTHNEVVQVLEEKNLGYKSKSFNLFRPVSFVGYSEVQVRLHEKHFINFKVLLFF